MNTPMPSTSPVPFIIQTSAQPGGLELWPLACVGLIVALALICVVAALWRRVQVLSQAMDDLADAQASYHLRIDTEMRGIKGEMNAWRGEPRPPYRNRTGWE